MLEKLKYINHLNEVVNFGTGSILIDKNNIRDFEWNYSSKYQKVSSFVKKPSKKKLPFLIFGPNARNEENRIHAIFEKDVMAGIPGRLYAGDYYIRGYFIGATKSDYNRKDIIKGTLEFVTDQNQWIKESKYVYRLRDEHLQGGKGYEYGYPYDYSSAVNIQSLYNTGFMDSEFEMVIYGPVSSPRITVSGQKYEVNVELGENEYLVINSINKTIKRVTARGQVVNEFSNRSLENYVFQKIPSGENRVYTNADFNYDITLLIERSEPEWI